MPRSSYELPKVEKISYCITVVVSRYGDAGYWRGGVLLESKHTATA